MAASTHRRARRALPVLAALWLVTGLWHWAKPLPAGLGIDGAWVPLGADDLRLLVDLTHTPPGEPRVAEQRIFDAQLAAIAAARRVVVLDAFLLNAMGGATPPRAEGGRALSSELVDALLARKRALPELLTLVVTDPINDGYGGAPSPLLARLREGGVDVVVTDLERLRDSNPAYSALWRLTVGWWDPGGRGAGWLPHPLGGSGDPVPLRAWLRLLQFKANHRKVLACDDGGGGWRCIVSSSNPHDASSAHGNVALELRGAIGRVVAEGELAVATMSGWPGWGGRGARLPELGDVPQAPPPEAPYAARYVTERTIERALVGALRSAGRGDEVDLAMFYLSDRAVVRALLAAADRGARVRLVLDPNRDAFGRKKDGVPNRQVADELVRRSCGAVDVRWYRTNGEQFHTKLVRVRRGAEVWATLGSANLTRRNLDDYNLEANVVVRASASSALARDLDAFFERIRREPYSAPFSEFEDRSRLKRLRYFLMEATGLSTF